MLQLVVSKGSKQWSSRGGDKTQAYRGDKLKHVGHCASFLRDPSSGVHEVATRRKHIGH